MGCFPTKITPKPEYDQLSQEKGDDSKDGKKVLKGDVTQRYEARKMREERLRQRQLHITSAAEELSSKVMEERETLSINSKSRATSRNTSRAGSPSLQKKQVTFNTVFSASPRTEMARVSETASDITDPPTPVTAEPRDQQRRTLTNGSALSVT